MSVVEHEGDLPEPDADDETQVPNDEPEGPDIGEAELDDE